MNIDYVVGQNQIQTLLNQLDTAQNIARVDILNKLSRAYWYSSPSKSIDYGEQALMLSQKLGYKKGIANAYNNMGVVHKNQGNYPQSLEFHFKALKIREEMGDEAGVAASSSNLGSVYQHQGNYTESLKYYEKCLEIDERSGEADYIASTLGSIGNVYLLKGDFTKAIEYHNKSLKTGLLSNNRTRVATALSNLGNAYQKQKEYEKAIEYLSQSLSLYDSLGDMDGISTAANYLAQCQLALNKLDDAEKNADLALQLGQKLQQKPRISQVYQTLYKIQEAKKDYQKALEYHKLFKMYQDSVINEESNIRASSIAFNFELEKKQSQIDLLNTERELQKVIRNAIGVGAVMLCLLVFVLYRNNLNKARSNKLLSEQKRAIEVKNIELQQQREEILAQRDNLEIQRKLLESALAKNEEQRIKITDSIRYAKDIQRAVLPSRTRIRKTFPEAMFYYRPKDIVSGDFYWFTEVHQKAIMAVVDCTGHGVPGAFMSMIGNILLDRIVNVNGVTESDKILSELHSLIRIALRQEEKKNDDGMDMSLIVFHQNSKALEFCGAKNPILLIQDHKRIELKGDKHAIGGQNSEPELQFLKQVISIDKPTTVFLFSDGYQDQIGGVDKKKFGKIKFYDFLLEIHTLTAEEQKNKLDATFNQWLQPEEGKSYEQRDDVTVVGIKIG
ncbi:MAG: hypothetical protein OHK0038_13900 [Flammeovirgaceae bacterium]